MTLRRSILALVLAFPAAAAAQTPAPYRPGLGDLMTMTVQPRHLKLGLAGQEKNWPYAVYEGHELEEAFERIAKQVPKWRELDIGQLINSLKSERIIVSVVACGIGTDAGAAVRAIRAAVPHMISSSQE